MRLSGGMIEFFDTIGWFAQAFVEVSGISINDQVGNNRATLHSCSFPRGIN